MPRKVGRPRKFDPRNKHHNIKLNGKEEDMLADLMEDLSMSEADVWRYLLHSHYSEHYYGKEYTGLR